MILYIHARLFSAKYIVDLQMLVVSLLKILVIFLLLDSVYLYFAKSIFGEMIVRIQRVAMQVRWWSAAVVYAFMTILLYWFIIKDRRPVWEATLLGLATYGIYDFTNYATLKNYDLSVAIMDTVWGATLFTLTTWILRF
jgi:uncharacterized membrane protein